MLKKHIQYIYSKYLALSDTKEKSYRIRYGDSNTKLLQFKHFCCPQSLDSEGCLIGVLKKSILYTTMRFKLFSKFLNYHCCKKIEFSFDWYDMWWYQYLVCCYIPNFSIDMIFQVFSSNENFRRNFDRIIKILRCNG